MTKVIWVFIIVLVLFLGWRGYVYWEKIDSEEANKPATTQVRGDNLPGLPDNLLGSYNMVKDKGGKALGQWLKLYGNMLSDPRKAWIQLDYCIAISRDNPAEARRVFAEVKSRLPASSPVMPRVQQLAPSYE